MNLPIPRERPWLSVDEVAEITGEGSKAIRAAIAAGQIPHLNVGRYIRVPTAALWALVGLDPDERTADTPALNVSEDPAPTGSLATTEDSGGPRHDHGTPQHLRSA